MKIRAIIVDNDVSAIKELETLLRKISRIDIIAKTEKSHEAITLTNELKPDLIFLDIDMPGMDGFELLENLEDIPEIVFVTKNERSAIRAYEFSALDYLLKPVDFHRLSEAVSRFEMWKAKEEKAVKEERLKLENRILIKDSEKCYFVPVGDIFLFESEGDYVRVHFGENQPLLNKTLSYLESRLPKDVFFRANRQFIFNINYVKKIDSYFNSTLMIELQSGRKIDLSQRQSAKFRDKTGF
ncbi:LytR/AlgR family response regulator transcription factor [Aquiflexum lacus]|uniref:LytR/AlgR family response regulator transcription factor n=1 Tax=Aquiflexum lacus TaxID=2483805 RepID=UPI001893A9AF|nr:LytTR family DNA-binding domain-containing protein [Aquiflexum lacus]